MGVSHNSHYGAECSDNDGEGDVPPELVADDGDNDESDVEGSDNERDGDFPPELVADDGDNDDSTEIVTIQPLFEHVHSYQHYAPIIKTIGSPLCVFLLTCSL